MREGRREGGKGEEEWMLSSIDSYLQDKISLTVKGKTDQTLFLKSEEVRIEISNCYLPLHTHNIPHPTPTSITTPPRYTHTSSYYTLTTHTSLCTHLSPHHQIFPFWPLSESEWMEATIWIDGKEVVSRPFKFKENSSLLLRMENTVSDWQWWRRV